MHKNTWLGIAIFGLFGVANEAMAQQPGYPTGSPRCRSREVLESSVKNGAVSVPSFCRIKDRDGYRWVADQYGGFWEPLVQRPNSIFTRGHVEGGRWTEVGAGWIADKPGSIWVEGHYKADGSWVSGYWEKGRANQEWVDGFWKDNRWQDGYWRDIPNEGYCNTNQTYVDSVSLSNLYVPEFCRENSRAGYSWNNDTYGGYWQPVSIKPGQVFIRGHADGDLGNWVGESWESEQPGKFFIQGRYDNKGGWINGKWETVKRGYSWTEGSWGKDGSWVAGSWGYDPSKACGNGILEEEIRFPKLFVPRYCHDSNRPGFSWKDTPYGGYWEPTTKKPGFIFVQGHVDAEFGEFIGESWEPEQPGKFFVQGRYDNKGGWINGEWKEIKKGYRWQDGAWGNDGSWTAGTYIFDPASQCTAKQTYVEEIKLAKLFVPRFCRDNSRLGYSWVNDTYGGYWQPNLIKPNQIFVKGHIDAEFGAWVGERIEAPRYGSAFEQGHYDASGAWIKGDWTTVAAGYKWNPGKYNSDGSWVAGVSVEDPTWTPTCFKGQVLVPAVKLSKLSVSPFCRDGKRKGMKWVGSEFGGWWAPDIKGYSTGTKVFVRGHFDPKAGWTGEAWLENQPGKVFVQGHYGPKGEWVEGKWLEDKAGFIFQEGNFSADGTWNDGKWVEDKGGKGGYGNGKGSNGGGGY
jgi:hypothetical protein